MTNDMTRGNPTRLIISFTLPVLFGNLCQQLYGMVDSIIVGRAISMEALAAVGATSGISFLVIGCIQGLTAGFSVITAQRFGAGDYEGVKRSVATSALLSLAATVLLTAAGILTARPLLEVMNTPADIIEDSYAYIIVIYYGVAATAFYNLLSCIIRALGDSKTPLIFLVFASFLNVALDLLFIITFHMGVGGAAWATVLSQGVSGLLCLGYAWRRFPLLRMEKRHWTFDWSYAWKHLRLALPMAMQFVITGTSVLVNQAVLNLFGSAAVAAFSAASKIHMLSEQVAVSFGTAMATYAGQNYGAGKAGRVQEGLRKCALACEAITLGIMVIMTAFGGVMSSWFIDGYHPEVIQQAHLYLFISALFYPALTMLFLYRNTLLGLGNGVTPMLAGVCVLLSRMIGAPVLGHFFGFTGLCWINPIAWVTASGLLFLSYRKTMRNIRPVDPTVDASDSNKIMN